MTDRYHSLTVVLDKDIREDDALNLMLAIKQLKGVVDVDGNVADATSYMAEARAKGELTEKLWRAFYE